MGGNKKKLTVIVPLFNQEKYIRQCVESIMQQSYRNIDILIIDDGSTDQSYAICKKLAEQDKRISIVQQKNKGLSGARKTGIGHAKTDYVTFVDADDFILPNSYIFAKEEMEKNIDMIFFEISRYFDEHNIKREYHILEEGDYDRERIREQIFPKLIWNFDRNTPGIECSQCVRIVKKEMLVEAYNNLEGKSFYYGEDIVITYPLMKMISTLVVISKSYYMHRQRIENAAPPYIVSNGYFDEIANMYKYLRMAMNKEGEYDFNKQIDYMYIYSVGLKKWGYGDYEYNRDFLFPFNKVPVGKRVILYGAGTVGNAYYKQILKLSYCKEVVWIDKNSEFMENPLICPISKLDCEDIRHFDYIIIAIENKKVALKVKDFFEAKGFDLNKIII